MQTMCVLILTGLIGDFVLCFIKVVYSFLFFLLGFIITVRLPSLFILYKGCLSLKLHQGIALHWRSVVFVSNSSPCIWVMSPLCCVASVEVLFHWCWTTFLYHIFHTNNASWEVMVEWLGWRSHEQRLGWCGFNSYTTSDFHVIAERPKLPTWYPEDHLLTRTLEETYM